MINLGSMDVAESYRHEGHTQLAGSTSIPRYQADGFSRYWGEITIDSSSIKPPASVQFSPCKEEGGGRRRRNGIIGRNPLQKGATLDCWVMRSPLIRKTPWLNHHWHPNLPTWRSARLYHHIRLKHAVDFYSFRNSFTVHVILQQASYLVDEAFI